MSPDEGCQDTLWQSELQDVVYVHDHGGDSAGLHQSERDGNWTLHVDTFAAMLPWLAIYDHTNYAR